MISTLTILVAFYLFVERRSVVGSLWVLAFSVTVRPDNILWVVLVLAFVTWEQRRLAPKLVVPAAAAMITYVVAAQIAGTYAWSTLFQHSFVESLLEPREYRSTSGILDYLRVYYWHAHPVAMSSSIVLMVALTVFATIARLRQLGRPDHWFWLLALSLVYMAMHWILFPSQKDRLWVGVYVFTMVALVKILTSIGSDSSVRKVAAGEA